MRNVLVSGGSRGLGLAIAETLASSGFRVIAAARNTGEALAAAQARVAMSGTGALEFEPVDLGATDGIGAFVRGVRARHGTLWGLVNNAASGEPGLLALASEAAVARTVQLNVLSPMLLTKHAVRGMMAGGGGRVVNVSSIIATTGYSGLSVYGATKAALVGFTRSLARELGPVGITVNAVAPGFVQTDMTGGMGEADRARVARRSALGRLAEPADVAGAVDYLFSERARNVTGTVLTVDAGSTA